MLLAELDRSMLDAISQALSRAEHVRLVRMHFMVERLQQILSGVSPSSS